MKKIAISIVCIMIAAAACLSGCGNDSGLRSGEAFPDYVNTDLFLKSLDEYYFDEADLGKRTASMVDQIYKVYYKGEIDSPRWRDNSNTDTYSFLWGLGALQTMSVAAYRAENDDKTLNLMKDLLKDISYYKPMIDSRLNVYLDDTIWKEDVEDNLITPRLQHLNNKILEVENVEGEEEDGTLKIFARTRALYYGSSPNGTDPYYDDNIWCVIAFLEAAEAVRNIDAELSASYFESAQKIMRYCLSGWNGQMGGGIKWKDTHGTKNSCINGPAALACTLFYDYYNSDNYIKDDKEDFKEFYLTWAETIYNWSTDKFRDPDDGLYWDSVELNDAGNILTNKTKFTYNTGTFLSSAVQLYRITGKELYKDHADETITNAYIHFISRDRINMPNIDIWPDGQAWFNVYLARGFMDYGKQFDTDVYVDKLKATMDYAWINARDYYGFIKCDWSGKTKTAKQNYDKIEGLMAAAGLEVTALLDVYYS